VSRLSAAAAEFLSFRLGGEEYGIEILKVQEIRSYEAPTRLANAPAFLLGIRNLRGVIVPVVDLRLRFGIAVPAYDASTVTIVLNVCGRTVGVVVDAVNDVVELQPAQMKPAPRFSRFDAGYLRGIGTIDTAEGDSSGARMLVLLDIEQLMGSIDLGAVQSEALA
jgi:purine-binding chemotaxis protein CheW